MAADSFDVILIADQAETSQGGVVTPAVRALLAELAPQYPERVFWADSRARIHLFRNVILKPNRQEAESACRELFGRVDFPALLSHTPRAADVRHRGRGRRAHCAANRARPSRRPAPLLIR